MYIHEIGRIDAEPNGAAETAPIASGPSEHPIDAAERQRILDALEMCAGNQTHAANVLGISRRTLVNKLDKFALPRPRKRER